MKNENDNTNFGLKSNLWDKLYIFVGAAILLSNLALYNQFPDQVGIHMSGGQIDQSIDKRVYMALIPLFMAGYYYYSKIRRGDGPSNRMILIVIMLAAHFMTLYWNFVGAFRL